MAIEDDIIAAFPGDDEWHRQARVAILRVYHAAENAEHVLEEVAVWIAAAVDNPPMGIFDRNLAEEADYASTKLGILANQLRRSSMDLEALKKYWKHFGGGAGGN